MLDLDSQILSHLAKRSNSSVAFDVNKRSTGCVAYNPAAKEPIYGYVPHIAPGVIFSVCFAVIFAATTFLTIRSRKWWYSALVLGVLGELVGWIGRIGAHYCPYSANIFSLQISILIIGKLPPKPPKYVERVANHLPQHPASTAQPSTTSSPN